MTDTPMSTFKVGDRVRHAKFGAGTVIESLCDDEPKGMVCVHFETWDEYDGEDDYHSIRDVALWRDPLPDTRKRLREYTDLRTGDEVDIAGVTLTVKEWSNKDTTLIDDANLYVLRRGVVNDMLVDEVRRKPRMKKRRVYEEVDTKEAVRGDIVVASNGDRYTYCKDSEVADGEYVLRLIEETEVER